MLRLKPAMSACVLASVFLQAVTTQAAIYYVDITGNDSNPGTSSQPWQTIAYAVSKMGAGDTTYVRGGTYEEGVIRFARSGTQSAPIKLLNAPGQFPVIDCIDASQVHRILIQHASGSKYPIGWITIEGFEIRNCYNGIKFHNLHDSIIRRNWVHDAEFGSGILGNGTRVLIDRNVINHNAILDPTPPGGHGIYADGTAFTITNNLIYDNRGYGIQLNGSSSAVYDPAKHAGPEYAESHDWSIANNTFAYSQTKGGMVVWGSLCKNLQIYNNIFYENGAQVSAGGVNGIDFVATGCAGIQIRNNLSYASGAGSIAFLGSKATEGVQYTQSGNIVNTDEPRFVNAPAIVPASPNFGLKERSPAIDKGLPLDEIRTDFNGTTRPKGRGYDIGAYEYSADGDVQSPTAPTALLAR